MDYTEFGWLNEPFAAESDVLAISPKADWQLAVESVVNSTSYGAEMVFRPFAPIEPNGPLVPLGRFALPTTHTLRWKHRAFEPSFSSYGVAVLGFLFGLHLLPVGAGHLHSTPHKVGHLVNFRASSGDVLSAMATAASTFDRIGAQQARKLFAAIHWYCVSQCYQHWHDRFAWMYTALDCLHAVAYSTDVGYQSISRARANHSNRISALHRRFGVPIPDAFKEPHGTPGNVDRLLEVRNQLIHEATFAAEPIGYAVTSKESELTHALQHFCSQIILSLLGIACEFRQAEWDSQTHALDVL
jgi:hypothetical protein